MRRHPRIHTHHVARGAPWVLPIALVVALAAALPPVAGGHASVASSFPAPDAALAKPPSTIRLVFGERITGGAGALRLVDAAGRSRAGAPRIAGREVSAPVRGALGPGRYAYAFAITSGDGHVLRRAFAFSVRSATPTAAATVVALSGRRLPLSGARVGVRTLTLWGGLEDGTAEWRHPFLDAPFIWVFRDGRATGMLPFGGAWRLTVRALDGVRELEATGSVEVVG